MKFKIPAAGSFAGAATALAVLFSALGSGAAAQDPLLESVTTEPFRMISQPVVQPLPAEEQVQPAVDTGTQTPTAASLAALVAGHEQDEELSADMRCLAGAIYFEAKGESLPGQLAVGRVVVNRARSGRFPDSYCGVVYQPSQFSFVRGRTMPAINTASLDWREALAIAHIAHSDAWRSPAEGALFFHARHVSPRWRLTRVGRIDNHVFYR